MTDRELLELIASQVGGLTKDMSEVKDRLVSVEKTVTHIENKHGEKLIALFDGYSLNLEKLDRIEKEVSKHEEVILGQIR